MLAKAVVNDSSSLAELAQQIKLKYGKLDILINNAGFTRAIEHKDLESLTDELIDDIFQVNVRGAFAAVRAMKPLLDASGDALIIN